MNNVVQLVTVDYTTYQSFTNYAAMTNTGLSASITPKFATSKILVICSAQTGSIPGSSVARQILKRSGGSVATAYSEVALNTQTGGYTIPTTTVNYNSAIASRMDANNMIYWFDSPATATSIAYTLMMSTHQASSTVTLNSYGNYTTSWGGVSHLTLMEIAQ